MTPPGEQGYPAAPTEAGGDRPRLKVGLLIGAGVVPRWAAEVIEEVADAEFIEPVVVVVPSVEPSPGGPSARSESRPALYRAYRFVDARLFRPLEDPFAGVDVAPRLAGIRRVALSPDDAPAEVLRAEGLDVLLNLAPVADPRELARAARHGVWTLAHGDAGDSRRDPPMFWEIYGGAPVVGTFLEAITDPSEPPVAVARSYAATDPISLRRNRDSAYRKSARFPVRSLRQLHAHGWDRIASAPAGGRARAGARATGDRLPTNAEMVRYMGRVGTRAMRRQVQSRMFYEEWFLAAREREVAGLPTDMHHFRVLDPPRGRAYADPFVVARGGRHHVFFEDYAIDDRKGRISVAELDADGMHAPRTALETAYHLSYPSVFEWDGEMYMLPETSANRTVELYRAVRYPDAWELARVLMRDVLAVDATLLRHGGRVWLFANMPVAGAKVDDELSLFWSDSLWGDWTPHPRNPIVSDVRCARPAGEIIRVGDRLYRPAQDGSGAYGSAVVFRQIDELSEDDYRESTVGRIDSAWLRGNRGTHTYNRDSLYEVVDGRRLRRRARKGASGSGSEPGAGS
jgi:hypothetical protein